MNSMFLSGPGRIDERRKAELHNGSCSLDKSVVFQIWVQNWYLQPLFT